MLRVGSVGTFRENRYDGADIWVVSFVSSGLTGIGTRDAEAALMRTGSTENVVSVLVFESRIVSILSVKYEIDENISKVYKKLHLFSY